MRKHQLTSIWVTSLFGVVGMLVCFSATITVANNAPVRIQFEKSSAGDGVWTGTVSGDVEGQLTTVLTDLRITGPVWHVEFDWIIDAGDFSFIAQLKGILNTNTGKVVMNGEVTEGWLLGANVHEEGQLVNPDTLGFEGTLRIMQTTAD